VYFSSWAKVYLLNNQKLKRVWLWVLLGSLQAIFFLLPADVFAQCTAVFSKPVDTVCNGSPLLFTNGSVGTGTITYLWEFGDASSPSNFSNAQNPSHSFTDTGLLTIKLIITDASSCTDTITDTVYVQKKPTTAFTRYDNCKQTVTKFKNATTTPANDSIAQWKWLFGTGDSSSTQNPQYTYPDTGLYAVKLIAYSAAGCSDTISKTLRVYSKPQISIADTQFCAGTSVNFDVAVTETSGVGYSWRFGDGNSSSNKAPLYTYNTAGYYHPRIKVTHNSGADSCFSQFDSVTVFGLPIVKFSIADDTLCYDGNNACIIDSTTKGTLGGGLWKRTLVFGDGFINNTTPISTSTICHNYSDPDGGSYPVSIEMTDSNSCFASKQITDAVVVLPSFTPSFGVTENKTCFTTQIILDNTSTFDSSKIASFEWDFGNGDTDTAHWLQTQYLYTTNGNFNIKLTLADTFGCPKTILSNTSVQSTVLNLNPTVNKDTSCFYNNMFNVSNPVNNGADAIWTYGDGETDTVWATTYRYGAPGVYTIKVRIEAPNCDTQTTVKIVTVLGPRANIGLPINRFQCMIHDTVYFVGHGASYLSNHGPAPGYISRIWDFKDIWAPQCTTDTKNGINVGLNCNYSVDSTDVKHFYTPGKEACYRPGIILKDTIWGCADSSYVDLALMPPKAGRDLTQTPIVQGLLFFKPDCLGPESAKAKNVVLNLTQPECARETFWVMWDSTCAQQSGNFNSNWRFEDYYHNYLYTSPPCDTGGRVTLGLIIRNGKDTANNYCYDTAWYHNVFQFNDLNPTIVHDFNPAVSRCAGTTVNFRVGDTTQTGITNYEWSFNDGTPNISGPSAYKMTHTFATKGAYTITLTMLNADGCSGSEAVEINIGFEGDFQVADTTVCVGEDVYFYDSIYYFDKGNNLWRLAARQTAGKETLMWDFGDGNGFTTPGSHPVKNFDKAGAYNVRLALKDSSGCIDTLTHNTLFTVYGAYASIGVTDTLVCPQLLQLIDSSKTYDPLNYLNIPAGDSMVNWKWTVAPNNLKSFLKDPFFDFQAGGDYNLKLVVENTLGCKDSATKNMYVKGPVPAFSIISDTLGCSPLVVYFDNQTINANKYTWHFRDANNNTLTTLSDSNVFNQYDGGGLYMPFLTAESSEYDSKQGRVVTCRAVFPDTANQTVRLVAVSGTPVANFGNTNACSSFSLNFIDSTTIDSGVIVSYHWDFGDGSTSTQQNPNHNFADTGTYTIQLIATASSGCSDTLEKIISVAPPPTARFYYKNSCFGHTTQFTDSSVTNNAYAVRWNWDFGDLGTSVLQNPTNLYAATGAYTVKLKILTNAGCEDSVTKTVTINPLPQVSFVAPNTCQYLAVPIVNSSATAPGGSLTYRWSFGNGDTSILANPAPKYNNYGSFTIKLIATSDSSCVDSTSNSITIHPKPAAQYNYNDTALCVNSPSFFSYVNTSNVPTGTATSVWNFGDGNTASTTNADYRFISAGIYKVVLIQTSDFGCKDSFSRNIYVYPKPTANFSINDTDQCLNTNAFAYTNSSIDTGALTYSWNFGDATTSSATDPNKVYAADNYFTVTLIATNGNQCKDTAMKDVHVLPVPNPAFTINDTGQCVNNNLYQYTNTSTINAGTLSSAWDFGDGATSTLYNATHAYTKDTGFIVTLITTSGRGCEDTISHTITVFPKPFPNFVANDSDQCINTNAYVFTNQTNIKYGNNTYVWYYGTGDSGNAMQGSYVYSADGDFVVTLKATSNNSCVDSIKKQVTVFPKPQASFIINDTNQCLNTNTFIFTGTSTVKSGGLRYRWYFNTNGGEGAYKKDTTLIATVAGGYYARLIAQSDFDCFDTVLTQFEAYPVPQVGFNINDTDQCLNENNFLFTNQSTISNNTPLVFNWNFGTEGSSTAKDPSFVFAGDTTHNIKLKVTSNKRCTDSLTKQIIVYPKPNMAFNINDTGQCVNGNVYIYTNQTNIKYGTLTYAWDFDNGETSTAKDTTIVYALYGKYKPELIATSDHSCKDTLVKDISVYPKPTPDFAVNDSDQCLTGNSYIITNNSTIAQGTMTYSWWWGDGAGTTQTAPVHSYVADTIYVIKLRVTSGFGCQDSTERQIIVYPQPQVDFTVNDSGQCVNKNLFVYTNTSAVKYGSLTYNWDFGNGTTAVAIDTSLVYNYDSNYRVVLRATTNYGCTDTNGHYTIVHSKPTPAFTVNDSDQCVNTNLFAFTNQTTIKQGFSTYNWDFGNGTTDTVTHPQLKYMLDSTYTVRMLATSNFGCVDSIFKKMLVFPKPIAGFDVNDSSQCINTNNFVFTNKSVIKYGTLTYAWDFGNTDNSTDVDPVYVYPLQGTFIVTLIPKSNNNCYDTAFGTSILFPKPNPAFTINDTDQCVKTQQFIFTDISTIDSGTYTQHWRYTDGEEYDSVNVTRIFGAPGGYDVELILTSDELCKDSLTQSVLVYPQPNPNFTGLRSYYCTDYDSLPLTPTVPGGIFSGKNMRNDTFVPRIPGNDTVLYTITVNGCTSDTAKYTKVFGLPNLGLPDDTTLCRQEFILLDVSFPNSTYLWSDGIREPMRRITQPGLYKITLYNACDTLTEEIDVLYRDYDCNFFFPTAFTPNDDGLNDVFLPYLEDVVAMRLQVFTRWGEMVFESTDQTKGWDGTYKGEPVQDGVYTWKVELTIDESGYTYTHTSGGTVTLFR
jgi:gliding motility-associated-like protein